MLIVFAFLSSCTKSYQAFYDGIGNVNPLLTDISLLGPLKNLKVTNDAVFAPNGLSSGGYSYGATIRLNDTTILIACNKYQPGGFDDFMYADIVAKKSCDNGATWGNEFVLQENIGAVNTFAPSFVRINSKHLIFVFGVKNSQREINILFRDSYDNGLTWGAVRQINSGSPIYYSLVNARVIYNKGRIIIPTCLALDINRDKDQVLICCFYSDDQGKTWKKSNYLKSNFALMEPAVTSTSTGQLLMTIRTVKGVIYFSKSSDNGKSWTNLLQTNISTVNSPQVIERVGVSDTLVMIWNNAKYTPGHNNRTPLTFAYSANDGQTWHNPVNIQTNAEFNYFYPSLMIDQTDTLHLTYGVRSKNDARPYLLYNKLSLRDLIK